MKRKLKRNLLRMISAWPPFLGAGIRVRSISPDFRHIRVELKLRSWNRNYVGTHFGGSLYSMCDPFYMLILIEALGPDYIVWDKAATIRFKKPGRGRVHAEFTIPEERIGEIRDQVDRQGKLETEFRAQIVDDDGTVIAEVDKILYIRRREDRPRRTLE